ncbi:hypothetical protein [Rothia dentocariosa]|uniref:hypothetical protein n=1 Tax=Rothia dentocariosa TaxID=2047 RepID=UPI00352EB076
MSEDPAALEDNPHSKRPVTVGKYPKIYLPPKFRLLITGIALIPVVMVSWLNPRQYGLVMIALLITVITASLANAYQRLLVTHEGFILLYMPLFRRRIAWDEVTDIKVLSEYDVVHETVGIGLRLAPGTGLIFGNLRRGPALKVQACVKGREKTYIFIFPSAEQKAYEAFVGEVRYRASWGS